MRDTSEALPERVLALLEKHGGWQATLDYIAKLEAAAEPADAGQSALAWMGATAESLGVANRADGLLALAGALTGWIDTKRREPADAGRGQDERRTLDAIFAARDAALRKAGVPSADTKHEQFPQAWAAMRPAGIMHGVFGTSLAAKECADWENTTYPPRPGFSQAVEVVPLYTRPPSEAAAVVDDDGDGDADYEVWQDGVCVAGASGPNADALREVMHYASQYKQDGPVELFRVIRRRIDIAALASQQAVKP